MFQNHSQGQQSQERAQIIPRNSLHVGDTHECSLRVFSDLVASNFPLLRNPQALSIHSPDHLSCLLHHWHGFHESSSLEQTMPFRHCMVTPVLCLKGHCTLVTKSPGGQVLKALSPQLNIRIKEPRYSFSADAMILSLTEIPWQLHVLGKHWSC